MEGDGKETGTGKGKMSCDHSHVPHALPQARNAYACARAIGSRVLGNQLSAILKYLRELWTALRD